MALLLGEAMLPGEGGRSAGGTALGAIGIKDRTTMAKNEDGGAKQFRDRADREKQHAKQLPGEDDPKLPSPVEPIRSDAKPKRNDPCSCGSGKKYKQCCGK